jgi:hypothetical protein
MTLAYKGLPFMFVRSKREHGIGVDKFIVLIAQHDYSPADTAWMMDDNLPENKTHRPTVDMLMDGDSTFEFDTEVEMIQFVANWYAENYPKK